MKPEEQIAKEEAEMRALLASAGFSPERIELAIAARRNRPHPSEKKSHPLKGKKHPRTLLKKENPAPGGQRGV
jgi:hypothetical protein